jgi:hypothetical protein
LKIPRVTSDASTVTCIVPGKGTSRAAGIVSVFAVGAGRLFCGGNGWADEAVVKATVARKTTKLTRRIDAIP